MRKIGHFIADSGVGGSNIHMRMNIDYQMFPFLRNNNRLGVV